MRVPLLKYKTFWNVPLPSTRWTVNHSCKTSILCFLIFTIMFYEYLYLFIAIIVNFCTWDNDNDLSDSTSNAAITLMLSLGNLFWKLASRATAKSFLAFWTVDFWLSLTWITCSSSVLSEPSCFIFSLSSCWCLPGNFDMLKSGFNNWVYCCQVKVFLLKVKVKLGSDGNYIH